MPQCPLPDPIFSATRVMLGFRITLNGTEPGQYPAVGYSTGSGTYWQIGNRYSHGQALNGHIGELIVMNTVLSNAGRQAMEGYLAHKWGLAGNLPNSHLYKSSPTSSAAPIISSSATASGTVGSAFSYTITTNVVNPLPSSCYNLPPGLSCNLGTGEITGSFCWWYLHGHPVRPIHLINAICNQGSDHHYSGFCSASSSGNTK